MEFLSTLSLRRATYRARIIPAGIISFLSTLSLRRATIWSRAFCDKPGDFYPRSPCGERQIGRSMGTAIALFLSTLSLRRATQKMPGRMEHSTHFYPRSPCGERPLIGIQLVVNHGLFLSTLSLRRATGFLLGLSFLNQISIHALLAESDP